MQRTLIAGVALWMLCGALSADEPPGGQRSTRKRDNAADTTSRDADAIKSRLKEAKASYEAKKKRLHKEILDGLTEREEAARTAGNKPLVDLLKAQRQALRERDECPPDTSQTLKDRIAALRNEMATAYEDAIKEYTRAGNDREASAVEKELAAFRKHPWAHVDLSEATLKEDYMRIPQQSRVTTKAEHSGPIELQVVARTNSENIRLDAYRGACVIFNWELNPAELRVNRPDGRKELESGSLTSAKVKPLTPGTWYRLRWRITEDGMEVFVNDERVFSERRAYDLSAKGPLGVRSGKSLVDVKELTVLSLKHEK